MKDCSLYANSMAGVSLRGSVRASLEGNRIVDGRASGVYVSDGATAELFGNVVTGNLLCGIEVEGSAAILIARRNELYPNGSDPICLPPAPNPSCEMEENQVNGTT